MRNAMKLSRAMTANERSTNTTKESRRLSSRMRSLAMTSSIESFEVVKKRSPTAGAAEASILGASTAPACRGASERSLGSPVMFEVVKKRSPTAGAAEASILGASAAPACRGASERSLGSPVMGFTGACCCRADRFFSVFIYPAFASISRCLGIRARRLSAKRQPSIGAYFSMVYPTPQMFLMKRGLWASSPNFSRR